MKPDEKAMIQRLVMMKSYAIGEEYEALEYAISSIKTDKARLKTDLKAMLEDLKKEMNPIKDCEYQIYGKEHWGFVGKCQDMIQSKIDKLKEEDKEQEVKKQIATRLEDENVD